MQVYRKDLYDAKGLKPADTYDQLVANAKALNDPANRVYGLALRGFAGAGQNMYIYPSLFRGFGGSWVQGGNDRRQLAARRCSALDVVRRHADAVRAARGAQLELARHRRRVLAGHGRDATSTRTRRPRCINNPEKSKVVGKIGYARWPKGPNGKRVTSIWNWGFPINAALTDKAKKATWLFIAWAASAETQARTSWKFAGPAKRSGVNRHVAVAARPSSPRR